MPFNPKVKTFGEVSDKLERISNHLEKLSTFLRSIDWQTVHRKPKGGHGEPGNNAPKWPPR